jgi:hypothetical protein
MRTAVVRPLPGIGIQLGLRHGLIITVDAPGEILFLRTKFQISAFSPWLKIKQDYDHLQEEENICVFHCDGHRL